MPKKQLAKILTSLAGEHLVAGQLCMRGYVASMTLKNYPGVDIFVLNPHTRRQTHVQVKAIVLKRRKKRLPDNKYPISGDYFVSEAVDELTDTPFVFVTIDPELNVEYYVVPCEVVAEVSAKLRREYLSGAQIKGKAVSQKQPRMIGLRSIQEFRDRWDLLRLEAPGEAAPEPAPQAAG